MRRGNVFMASVIALALAVVSPGAAAAAPLLSHGGYGDASLEVDVGLFYDDLSPYGQWVEYADYGWVWVPRVSHGWRPYSVGHWVWTEDYGWLWVSDEQFGWATCHYGRWLPDPSYGWVWVPGYEWGPAWVSWRSGGGYIGWAPLPPRVSWEAGFGLRVGGAQIDAYIAPQQYVFVEERVFVDPAVHRHLLPTSRNTGVINVTHNVTNYHASGDRVVNRSVSVDEVQRVTGHAVPRARAVEVDSVKSAHHAREKGGEVPVFRPKVREKADRVPPQGKALGRKEGAPKTGQALPGGRPEVRENERLQKEQREKDRSGQLDRQRVEKQREADRRDSERRLARQQQDQQREQKQVEKQREADRRDSEKRLARERQQQEEQRRDLDKRQAREREQLEKQHRQEIKHPPRDVASGELERRHEEQHRGIEERQHRERQQAEAQRQEARQQREQQQRTAESREKKPEKRKDKPKDKPDRQ